MERRQDVRFPADVPGTLTRLRESGPGLKVRIDNISEGGIRFEVPEALECGSFILVEIEDSTFAGEIKYCRATANGYLAGMLVERVLMGASELSQLIGSTGGFACVQ